MRMALETLLLTMNNVFMENILTDLFGKPLDKRPSQRTCAKLAAKKGANEPITQEVAGEQLKKPLQKKLLSASPDNGSPSQKAKEVDAHLSSTQNPSAAPPSLPEDSKKQQGPASKAAPLSVSELTLSIKSQLEMAYGHIIVQGEVSNFKRHTSGHLYFSLKDEGAQIQVACFQASAQKLRFEPRDGDQIIIKGQLTVYKERGQYQIIAKSLEKVGLGEILLRLEALKKELKSLGWFDSASKKSLPYMPERIGVVTSPTGAVIRDIVHVLSTRHSGFQLILYPAKVQGAGAALEVAAGVRFLNRHKLCDCIIVARGGGSFEDLMAFNDRELLTAIHESELPVISAVGHETDFTLCDFVADLRAPTPSAAAERALPLKAQLYEKIQLNMSSIRSNMLSLLRQLESRMQSLAKSKLLEDGSSFLHPCAQALDDLAMTSESKVKERLDRERNRLLHFKNRASPFILHTLVERTKARLFKSSNNLFSQMAELKMRFSSGLKERSSQLSYRMQQLKQNENFRLQAIKSHLSDKIFKQRLEAFQNHLRSLWISIEALSPKSALRRGYAIIRNHSKILIKNLSTVTIGEDINIEVADGKLQAKVEKITLNSSHPKEKL